MYTEFDSKMFMRENTWSHDDFDSRWDLKEMLGLE